MSKSEELERKVTAEDVIAEESDGGDEGNGPDTHITADEIVQEESVGGVKPACSCK